MKRYSEARRKKLVREYESSGRHNATAFCRRRRISAGSLANWRRRYGATAEVPEAAALQERWVPVRLAGASDSGGGSAAGCGQGYVVTFGHARLEVPRGFDLPEVRQLCSLLGLGHEEDQA